jgi:predicted nucleic acid-binding protein
MDSSPELENDKTPVSRWEKTIQMHFRAMEFEIQVLNEAITNIKANLSDVSKAVKNLSRTLEMAMQVFSLEGDVLIAAAVED